MVSVTPTPVSLNNMNLLFRQRNTKSFQWWSKRSVCIVTSVRTRHVLPLWPFRVHDILWRRRRAWIVSCHFFHTEYTLTAKSTISSVNVPWPDKGMGDAEYIYAFQKVIMPIAMEFAPELVISKVFIVHLSQPILINSCSICRVWCSSRRRLRWMPCFTSRLRSYDPYAVWIGWRTHGRRTRSSRIFSCSSDRYLTWK